MAIDTEISAGAVIYTKNYNIIKFLLVFSARNNEWGFAKGHVDKGETYMEAAKREIFEETGISAVKFVNGFMETECYKIQGTLPETAGRIITKKVIYYLCYTDSNYCFCKDEEISRYKWIDLETALSLLPYQQQKNLIKKTYKFITEVTK